MTDEKLCAVVQDLLVSCSFHSYTFTNTIIYFYISYFREGDDYKTGDYYKTDENTSYCTFTKVILPAN